VARYAAIAAVGEAVVDLLKDASRQTTDFAAIAVEPYQATDFQSPMKEGISVYLYRVTVNGTRRNRPPRVGRDGKRYRPSLPLDLHYLVTAWAESAGRQQRLLGWCLRELENALVLPAGLLNHHGPEHDTFDPAEAVELVCAELSLDDLSNLADATQTKLPPSMVYVARMVLLDSELALEEARPVQTRAVAADRGPN
jgi:hypothetical protein